MELIKLPIADVKFDDTERQRKGIGTIDGKDPNQPNRTADSAFEELKLSIQQNGLLQPIGVTSNNELLFGFRRLHACKAIGWTEIDALVDPEKDFTELDKQLVELEENIRRLDLSWHEQQTAIAKVDRIRRLQNPETHNQKKTAQELGISQSDVSRATMMDQMLNLFPELKKAKSLNAAISQAKSKAKTIIRKVEVASNPKKYEEVSKKIIHGYAEKLILDLPDAFTKHIVTDGPFGIDYDNRQAASGAHEAYADSPEAYRERTAAMAPHMYRILHSDGFLVWFLAHDHFEWTKNLFRSVGFDVDPVPLMWNRSESRCYTTRPDKYFGKGFDIALHCIKGEPQMINRSRMRGKNGSGNVFTYKGVPVSEKEHIVERPIELYQDIIQCISLEGEKIVDFFSGSGKVAAAAASLKRDFWACEMNPNHVTLSIQNVYANTPQVNGQ